MTLQYTEKVVTVTEKKTALRSPKQWGMYTSAGNRSLFLKSETLLKKIERLQQENAPRVKLKNAVKAFYRSYERMCNNPNYPEASDTAVRDAVCYFAERAWKAAGLDPYSVSQIWGED
jgi:hypothetical protein